MSDNKDVSKQDMDPELDDLLDSEQYIFIIKKIHGRITQSLLTLSAYTNINL